MKRHAAVILILLVPAHARAEDLFLNRVAPLFEQHCTKCHGGAAPKGGLSLVSAKGLQIGATSGPVVSPGKPDESLLLKMVSGDKPKMPKNGKPLSSEERESLRRWIADGAKWPVEVALKQTAEAWWSLQPLRQPAIPTAKNRDWICTPIDAFVLHQLEAKGLKPSPEADRRTLIRRLSFDLLGLPPTPAEIEAFAQDQSPDAYEQLVDRLLASPHYGERWGRHWLDVVHYGDTHGYDKDKRRPNAWPYRDYVIRSLNQDKPYVQFVQEQLAGDVLRPNDPEGIIASAFIAAGPWDFVGHVELREGTVEKEKTRVLDRDDMVASTIGTFMSLTVHCARCHDHKFDPIAQRDYYRLQAVFAGVERGDRPIEEPALATQRQALVKLQQETKAQHDAAQAKIAALATPELGQLDQQLKAWKERLVKLGGEIAQAAQAAQPGKEPSPTNGYHSGIMPSREVTKWVQVDLGKPVPIDEIHLVPARPTDFPDTPGFGFPQRFRVEISDDPMFAQAQSLADHTQADFTNPGDEAVLIAGGGRQARYIRVTATRLWKRTNDFVFALAELQVVVAGKNVAGGAAVTALDSIEAGRWSMRNLVDGFSSRTKLPEPADSKSVLERQDLRHRIEAGEKDRQHRVDELTPPELKLRLKKEVETLAWIERDLKALPAPVQVYSAVPRAPRPIHVLRRGEVEQPKEQVSPGGIAAISELPCDFQLPEPNDEGARRAALAEWIADPRNPLTWRSIVNRVWHFHFGKGLVDTPNDFGRNGSQPTHPELLDWLALAFRDQGGSLKQLHRLIVTSSVYRQSSASDAAYAKIDGDNCYLWRMNRQRLDAESVRDAVLAASGKLDLRIGGPGYDLFRFRDDHSPEYDHTSLEKTHDPATYRRTVYRFVVRSVPNPFLDCLDCADPNSNTPVRNTTLTALQALALLNDPFMVRQAELLAERVRQHSDDPARQIEQAFLFTLGRTPRIEERAGLTEYARRHGLANACRVLFNANEFVFVD